MLYTVQRNDSPARIAAKLTGSAANMNALLAVNRHKPMMTVGGRTTFSSLHVGEKLNVPASWSAYSGGALKGKFGGGGSLFGVGFGLGQTSDANLLQAAQAVTGANINWGGSNCPADPSVTAFQNAWNSDLTSGTDPNMAQATDTNGNVIGQLTVDGKYGAETAAAVQAALGSQSPTPCTYGGGGGGGNYSAAVISAAQALDSYLHSYGCTNCGSAGQPPNLSDPLSPLVSAFKDAILVTPSCGSNACPTVTGSTINMTSAACAASFGPGTLSDLQAVLGSAMTYSGQGCTDSNCNCLTGGNPPPPSTCTAPLALDSSSVCRCNGGVPGASNGTTDGNLCTAAQALIIISNPCDGSTASNAAVAAFQSAWSNTSDSTMGASAITSGVYDAATAAALNTALGQNVAAAACTAPPPPPAQPPPCVSPGALNTAQTACVCPSGYTLNVATGVCTLAAPPHQCPPGQIMQGGQCITPPATASSGGAGALVAGVLILGVGGAATYYALKGKKHAHGHHAHARR